MHHDEAEACVERVLEQVGPRVVLGIPLGVGKPNHFVNALYRRVRDDPDLELELHTALSLVPPEPESELERRLVEPIRERLYGDDPGLDYAVAQRRGELPDNVRVSEFYLSPGDLLGSPSAQQHYVSANYTHAARDFLAREPNVIAQLVAPGDGDRVSLGSNPDLTLDLLEPIRQRRRAGDRVVLVAQTNGRMPYMPGDAEVPVDTFDHLLQGPDFPLFAPPKEPVGTADWLIGLHASALVCDGGTLQLGIGTLGDAVTAMLRIRHQHPAAWGDLLAASVDDPQSLTAIGGDGPFEHGLFANTEMLVGGFLDLYEAGVLKRRAWPHAGVQRLVDAGRIGERVGPDTLRALVEAGHVPRCPGQAEVAALREAGVLASDVELAGGQLRRPGAPAVPADLRGEHLDAACEHLLGERLRGGHLAHASFFLGARDFYEGLRGLDPAEREAFRMTRISWVNELAGDEGLKRAQRRHARFLNECMMVTGLGGVVSDGLEDGRVVSGVGGQYNFVAMAHALPEGRSVLMLPSTRRDDGQVRSNLRWSYGHCTIPRHLRDLVVTEYGVADLRGKSDREVVQALVAIADARFQDDLVDGAQRAGKLPVGWRVPDRFRRNRPGRLEEVLAPAREQGLCPRFPLGSDLTEVEADLVQALRQVAGALEELRLPGLGDLDDLVSAPDEAAPYLERMGLDQPSTAREHLLQRAVVYGLILSGVL